MSDFFSISGLRKTFLDPIGLGPSKESEKTPEVDKNSEETSLVGGVVDKVTLLGDKVGEAAEGLTKFTGGVTAIGAKSSSILTNTALNFVGIEGEDAKEASKWLGGMTFLSLPVAASSAGIGVASWAALKAFGVEPQEKGEKPTLLGTYASEVNKAYDSGGQSASKIVKTLRSRVKSGVDQLKSTGQKVKRAETVVQKVQGRLGEIAEDIQGDSGQSAAKKDAPAGLG